MQEANYNSRAGASACRSAQNQMRWNETSSMEAATKHKCACTSLVYSSNFSNELCSLRALLHSYSSTCNRSCLCVYTYINIYISAFVSWTVLLNHCKLQASAQICTDPAKLSAHITCIILNVPAWWYPALWSADVFVAISLKAERYTHCFKTNAAFVCLSICPHTEQTQACIL